MLNQHTLARSVRAVGVALHSGTTVELSLHPAPIDHGIVFRRTDLDPPVDIAVAPVAIGDTRLASTLVTGTARISTIEHLMSACAGLGLDNLRVDVSGPEIPIMDGSAASFVYLLQQAGIQKQDALRRFIRIKDTVEVREGEGKAEKWARLEPCEGFTLDFFIEFNHPAIDGSAQWASVDFAETSYVRDIARARTFGFVHEVETLRGLGLARGGSTENAIVLDEYRVLTPGGLRYQDEFVRHKILDAIGDLYVVGAPLLAAYTAHKSGHGLNNQLLRALLERPEAWEWVTFPDGEAQPATYARQTQLEWDAT